MGETGKFFRRIARFIRFYGACPSRIDGRKIKRLEDFTEGETKLLEIVQDGIQAEELTEQFCNQREKFNDRWCELLLRRTGDTKLVDRVMKKMITDEIEAKIDASGK